MKHIIILFSCIGFLFSSETKTEFNIEGMMCSVNCPQEIQKSLNNVKGVKSCTVDFDSKTATVTYDDEKINSEDSMKEKFVMMKRYIELKI